MRRSPVLLIVALAGCGSADALPAPEAPPRADGEVRLDTRARTLTVGSETVDAGAGPADFAETPDRVYVTDVVQEALLVFEKEPDLHLQRRAYLAGRPTGLGLFGALDRAPEVIVRLADGERVQLSPGGVER